MKLALVLVFAVLLSPVIVLGYVASLVWLAFRIGVTQAHRLVDDL